MKKKWAYHNDSDSFVCAWLRNLIKAGLVVDGEVDERSIQEVSAEDIKDFIQCHFFAGIGGWSYALRLAGWPDDRPVWTGSCPCQPLSSAGKRQGEKDERHLWPAFCELIGEQRPPTIFGEQVASKDGREWLSAVHADLEGMDYAVGAADLCAAGVGAPHIRQRLYWVADAKKLQGTDSDDYRGSDIEMLGPCPELGNGCNTRIFGKLGDFSLDGVGTFGRQSRARSRAQEPLGGSGISFWSRAEWLDCRDGKARPVEPGIFPLAHGVPGRVAKLRAIGNAIVPQVAAEFIGAYLDATQRNG
jgi:DNA (cytosine-5)-methyltransferase 1